VDWLQKIATILKKFGTEDHVIHFHNPGLGKNPVLTWAMAKLAIDGYPVFNHIHDFPEDRPENLKLLRMVIEEVFEGDLNDTLYPARPNVQFGVLSSKDRIRLNHMGIPNTSIHVLWNPVRGIHPSSEADRHNARAEIFKALLLDEKKPLVTYPVRIIRRKNIGELVLLAAIFKEQIHFLATLPPQNPVEKPFYDSWKKFCRRHHIDLYFEVGQKLTFETVMRGSDFCITTSIMEGFGMVYLEPWTWGVPIVGRNLENITPDLRKTGMQFPLLYDRLEVPYNNDWHDFKDLPVKQQEIMIRQVLTSHDIRQEISDKNAYLDRMFNPVPKDLIRNNQEIIKREFTFDRYGERLYNAYQNFF
jgi:glycosyltransferase involved in cell wall biosynthesis